MPNNYLATTLVIEYDTIQRDLITLALKRIPCLVHTAENAKQAVEIFEEVSPEIVIIDLFLPQMSGLEIIDQFRSTGKLARTTVIVISSFGFPEVVQQVKDAGAYDFIVKPFESDLLIQRVIKAIERRKQ